MAFNPVVKFSESSIKRYPLKASETVAQGDVITLLRSTGIAQKNTGTAGETFLGFATEGVTADDWTRAGATSGNIAIQVANGGERVSNITITGTGSTGILTAADMGKTVFATDENSFTVVGGNVPIGTLVPINTSEVVLVAGGFAVGQSNTLGAVQLFAFTASPNGTPFSFDFNYTAAQIANGDLVTAFPIGTLLGGSGMITGFTATVTTALTASGATAAMNIEIGSTNLTGGVLTVTFATHATKGTVVSATAITAANFFTAADTISIEAASVTTFTAGQITLTVSGYKTGV